MTPNIAVLMIGIMFFNLAGNCFPQPIDVESQAKTDATADMKPAAWFLLGAMPPIGCLIGYAIGTSIDPKPVKSDYYSYGCWTTPNETQINSACIGGVVGVLMLPVSYALMPINPSPERLLGKPPEYVSAYTSVYKRHTRDSRITSAASGFAVGSAISCLFGLSIWKNLQED